MRDKVSTRAPLAFLIEVRGEAPAQRSLALAAPLRDAWFPERRRPAQLRGAGAVPKFIGSATNKSGATATDLQALMDKLNGSNGVI